MVVNSKFIFYDADEDGALNRFEEFNFQNQLGTLFGCTNFFHHLNELMNSNNDGQISLLEWNTFFGVSGMLNSHAMLKLILISKFFHTCCRC